jgi:hypothetical protein
VKGNWSRYQASFVVVHRKAERCRCSVAESAFVSSAWFAFWSSPNPSAARTPQSEHRRDGMSAEGRIRGPSCRRLKATGSDRCPLISTIPRSSSLRPSRLCGASRSESIVVTGERSERVTAAVEPVTQVSSTRLREPRGWRRLARSGWFGHSKGVVKAHIHKVQGNKCRRRPDRAQHDDAGKIPDDTSKGTFGASEQESRARSASSNGRSPPSSACTAS